MQSVNVQQLPYVAPRKRTYEFHRFVVKYFRPGEDTLHFQWFQRDVHAVKFLNERIAEGYVARLQMKK